MAQNKFAMLSRQSQFLKEAATIKIRSEAERKAALIHSSKPAQYLVFSLSLLPPLLLAFLVFKYGVDFIDWDQWTVAAFFVKASQGSLSLSDLFAQQAEYRQFFPNLIFIGLGWLTHWNIRYEMLVSFLLGCVIAFNLYRLGQVTMQADRSRRLLLVLVANLLIFAPAQYESWLLGEQIIYFMPAACLTTCLAVCYSKVGYPAKLIICLLLSVVATFSSANGFACWLVLAPVLFFLNPRGGFKSWGFFIWVIAFGWSLTRYLYDFRKPAYTPSLWSSVYHPWRGLFFFCSFLGAPLATSNRFISVSAGIGAISAALFIASCFYVWKLAKDPELKRRLTVWLMLGAYSFVTAVIVTIARMGFGPEQAVASRYITFSVYLLVSLCYLIPIILEDLTRHGRLTRIRFRNSGLIITFVVSSVIILHLLNSAAAVRQMAWMKMRRLQAKACLLFIDAVPNECLAKGFPDLDVLKTTANAINDLGLLRPSLIKSNRIQAMADPNGASSGSYGSFEKLSGTEKALVADGWAALPERSEPADAVLLTYEKDQSDPVILGFAQMRISQPSFAAFFLRASHSNWRWQESFSLDQVSISPPFEISAWAFDATTGKAHKLQGTFVIEDGNYAPRLRQTANP
jgi:hypothetical protein